LREYRRFFAALLIILVMTAGVIRAAAQTDTVNFVGSWQIAMEGRGSRGPGSAGGPGGQGGAGGPDGAGGDGSGRSGRGGQQVLTIAQDGEKFKVTRKSPRGDETFEATASGNAISWTETREGRDGNSRSIEYKATVDGDTMKGTMAGGQFSRPFTAKRSSQNPN
jgi:hypothetical protein